MTGGEEHRHEIFPSLVTSDYVPTKHQARACRLSRRLPQGRRQSGQGHMLATFMPVYTANAEGNSTFVKDINKNNCLEQKKKTTNVI